MRDVDYIDIEHTVSTVAKEILFLKKYLLKDYVTSDSVAVCVTLLARRNNGKSVNKTELCIY